MNIRSRKLAMQESFDMTGSIVFSRDTRHWTTIINLLCGLFFLFVGIIMFFLLLKNEHIDFSILFFSIVFSFAGSWVSVVSIDKYFIRPEIVMFYADKNNIRWGTVGKKERINYSELDKISFFVDGTDMDSIHFCLKNGESKIYMNNSLMAKHELLHVFQFINVHFDGITFLNNA